MKLTSRFRTILSLLTIGMLACSGAAVAQTTDGYDENFEGFTVDDLLIEAQVGSIWSGSDTNVAVIVSTNYTGSYQGGTDYPIAYDHSTLTKAVSFEGVLTNTVTADTPSITNWVDMVLNPTFNDGTIPDLPPLGSVAGVYFSSNGTLMVSHMTSDVVNVSALTWVETDVVIGENDWIRLTIAANMNDGGEPFAPNLHRFYQIYINGDVVTNAAAFQSPSRASGGNGSWFGSPAGFSKTTISGTTFSGTGFFDDLVITNSLALTPAVNWTITATANANGSITPSGAVSVSDGGSREFTIAPDSGFDVGDVVIVENGVTTTNSAGITTYTFSGVIADGSITANFVEAVVTTYTITPAVVGSGTITPSSPQVVDAGSNSVEFTFAAVDGWMLDYVETVENGVTTDQGVISGYTFMNVMSNGWITAYFVDNPETPTTNWFSETGLTEAQMTENRGDGMTRGAAWLASVDPLGTNTLFEVNRIWSDGATNYIEWVSVYVDESLPPFGIWARTNLMDSTYDVRGTLPRPAGPPSATPITNVWWELAPEYPVYYRVAATNAPPAP